MLSSILILEEFVTTLGRRNIHNQQKLSYQIVYVWNSKNLLRKPEKSFMWGWNKLLRSIQRFLQDFDGRNGESTDTGMGKGVEVIVTEQGGGKQHHLGHEAILMNMCLRQKLINFLVSLTGDDGLC